MGGDHGPSVVIPACAQALAEMPGARLLLHGDETVIQAELSRLPALAARSEVRHSDRVISMEEKPAQAMRRGKGTSMWNAVEAIREGQAAAAVSAHAVLLVDDLTRLAEGLAAARRARKIALQSVWAGLGLSFAAMLAAAFGYITVVEGALMQEAIDVAVILNALRALR
mgnify:CR=1 FL=1